jgi:heme-degrading monooxygenase HmoA
MYIIIWEYQVKPDKQAEFEKIYAANGTWAELFKKGTGYLGTELIRSTELPEQYVTIDR